MKKVTIIACAYNEGLYIREWLEYHKLLGVRNFILIIDKRTTDNTMEQVNSFSGRNDVIIAYDQPKNDQPFQPSCYNDAFNQFREYVSEYIAVINCDEFLSLENALNLEETLLSIPFVGGLWIPWKLFGPSNHLRRPSMGLLIENYQYYDPPSYYKSGKAGYGKTIFKTDQVVALGIHTGVATGGIHDEFGQSVKSGSFLQSATKYNKLAINHYMKSIEDFIDRRINQPRANCAKQPDISVQAKHLLNYTTSSIKREKLQDKKMVFYYPELHKRILSANLTAAPASSS